MKILIVEDSTFQRSIITKYLKQSKAEILQASSADMAVPMVEEHKPDVILTDLVMAGMSGIEFIKKVRELHPLISIFVLSADCQSLVQQECFALGVKGFFQKPFNYELFVNTLKEFDFEL